MGNRFAVAEAGHPKLHGWEGQAFINAGCPQLNGWGNIPIERTLGNLLGGPDLVEVTGATPQILYPMKGWPQKHRRTDVEEPTTKFWVRKVVDGAGPPQHEDP